MYPSESLGALIKFFKSHLKMRKKSLLSIFCILLTFVVCLLFWPPFFPSFFFRTIQQGINRPPFFPERNSIIPITGTKAFIFSAFLDDRTFLQVSPVIRIIGIGASDEEEGRYCHVKCESNTISTRALTSDLGKKASKGVYCVLCRNPCVLSAPISVAVSAERNHSASDVFVKIHNAKESQLDEPRHTFTVCVSTMLDNYNNVLQLIHLIEMYRLLGADKVFMYKISCSDLVLRVLNYYTRNGFVEVISWNMDMLHNVSMDLKPGIRDEMHHHIQNVFTNDCVYRNMYTSRYLILNGPEEILIPNEHKTWINLLEALTQKYVGANVFLFDQRIFPAIAHHPDSLDSPKECPQVPGVNILNSHYKLGKVAVVKKVVVDPKVVIGYTSKQFVLEHQGTEVNIPSEVAEMRLYSDPVTSEIEDVRLQKDNRLQIYRADLEEKMKKVCRVVSGWITRVEMKWYKQWTHWNAPIIGEGTFNREVVQNHFTKENPIIGLTVFAIGKYLDAYLEKFLLTAEMHFMKGYRVIVYVIVDDPSRLPYIEFGVKHSYKVFRILKEDRWQDISMMRMKTLSDLLRNYIQYEVDYVFCMDVDQYFLAPYSVETLGELVAQAQAWFFHESNYKFTYERRPQSTAYIADGMGDYYYHAAVFGGRPLNVLKLVEFCFQNIVEDKKKNIEAVWHDESHLNKYFLLNKPTKILNPDYCWDYNIAQNSNAKLAWATKDYANLRQK
ncbi:uncharacterized protein LOC114656995 [Erpetoichthys calabaricus]|uniref:N-acetyllactosaminide alpha-1,3-galactosyltransferase n=1 Tax=Erpetoichthys calabaricus TaxID=27687 RepID=A0A8C4SBF9_ERPCA|nr:uncharacterized protein LOC114656995 [Erpetoichthys calabaricus]